MNELFMVFMAIWGVRTVESEGSGSVQFLFVTLLLVAMSLGIRIVSTFVDLDGSIFRIALTLSMVSALTAFSYGKAGYMIQELLCGCGAAVVAVLFVKTGLYRYKLFGFACMGGIPFLLVMTRILGKPAPGSESYIEVLPGILTLSVLLAMLPFACAYGFTNEVDRKRAGVTALPWNQILLLGCSMLGAFVAGVVNSEFGTTLLLGGSVGILFLFYGRNLHTKLGFALLAFAGVGIIFRISSKVQLRMLLVTNLEEAVRRYPGEAKPIEYLQAMAPSSGLLGMGNGELSRAIYANLTTDYVWSSLFYNQGLLFAVLVAVLFLLLIVKLLRMDVVTGYDRILVDTFAVLLGLMLVCSLGGCLGVLPLTGIGVGFLSVTKSINLTMYGLLGMSMCLKREGMKKGVIKDETDCQ